MLNNLLRLYRSNVVDIQSIVDDINEALDVTDFHIAAVMPSIVKLNIVIDNIANAMHKTDKYFLLTGDLKIDLNAISRLPTAIENVDYTVYRTVSRVQYVLHRKLLLVLTLPDNDTNIIIDDLSNQLRPGKVYCIVLSEYSNITVPTAAIVNIYKTPFLPYAVRYYVGGKYNTDAFTVELLNRSIFDIATIDTIDELYYALQRQVTDFNHILGNSRTDENYDIMTSLLLTGRTIDGDISFLKYFYSYDKTIKAYVRSTYLISPIDNKVTILSELQDGAAVIVSPFIKDILLLSNTIELSIEDIRFTDIDVTIAAGQLDKYIINLASPVITKDTLCTDGTLTYSIRDKINSGFVIVTYVNKQINLQYYESPQVFDKFVAQGTIEKLWLITNIQPLSLQLGNSDINIVDYALLALYFILFNGVLNIKQLPLNATYFLTQSERMTGIVLNNTSQQTFIVTNHSNDQSLPVGYVLIVVYYNKAALLPIQLLSGYNYSFDIIDLHTNMNVKHLYQFTLNVTAYLRQISLQITLLDKFKLSHKLLVRQMFLDTVNGKPVFDVVLKKKFIPLERIVMRENILVEV